MKLMRIAIMAIALLQTGCFSSVSSSERKSVQGMMDENLCGGPSCLIFSNGFDVVGESSKSETTKAKLIKAEYKLSNLEPTCTYIYYEMDSKFNQVENLMFSMGCKDDSKCMRGCSRTGSFLDAVRAQGYTGKLPK
jgi:hypothetical protein